MPEEFQDPETIYLSPQDGPQMRFASTSADIGIYGGAAGGGKTWQLLYEPLRHIENKRFGGVIFRKTTVQIRNEGALWDESEEMYGLVGGAPREHELEWNFSSGATISFSHMEYDKNRRDWQGAQIAYIGFDELTHFSAKQFWYLVGRNRSMSGVRPYIRATCNPDPDSFVRELIAWWIDPETGLPIPERDGVLRWFVRVRGVIHWADTREDIVKKFPKSNPKSLTFIAAKLSDNKKLLEKNPEYQGNLEALSLVDRERLLGGNWNIRESAGMVFRRSWFQFCDADEVPKAVKIVRRWDLAATEDIKADWTAGVKMLIDDAGRYFITDARRDQLTPYRVLKFIKSTAEEDGKGVKIIIPQDPAQAGKYQAQDIISKMAGYDIHSVRETGDKVTRAKPFSAQVEAGIVYIVRGPWNNDFLTELENFPDEKSHDDYVDASDGAFNDLAGEEKRSFR